MSGSAELASKLVKDQTLNSTPGLDSNSEVDWQQNLKHNNGQLLSFSAIIHEEPLVESTGNILLKICYAVE